MVKGDGNLVSGLPCKKLLQARARHDTSPTTARLHWKVDLRPHVSFFWSLKLPEELHARFGGPNHLKLMLDNFCSITGEDSNQNQMWCVKIGGMHGFLGPSWVLITTFPRNSREGRRTSWFKLNSTKAFLRVDSPRGFLEMDLEIFAHVFCEPLSTS